RRCPRHDGVPGRSPDGDLAALEAVAPPFPSPDRRVLVISQATQEVDMVVLGINAWEARTTVTRADARWVLPAGEPDAEHVLCVKTHPAGPGQDRDRTLLAVVEHPGRILGIYPVRPDPGVDLDPRGLLEDVC